MAKFIAYLFGLIGVSSIIAALAAWRGYVLSVLWLWFIVATFGVPAISIPAAIGIMLIVGMFKNTAKKNTHDVEESAWETLGKGFVVPLIVLGMGWIVKGVM